MTNQVGFHERERILCNAVQEYPRRVRFALLRDLLAPSEERAASIRRLWNERPGAQIAELLIDLESDRQTALDVAELLKDSLHDGT